MTDTPQDPRSSDAPGTGRQPATGTRSRAPWVLAGALAGAVLVGGGAVAGFLVGRAPEVADAVRADAADVAGRVTATPAPVHSSDPVAETAAVDPASPRIAGDDIELHGEVLERAVAAALAATGGEGVVRSAERSDDAGRAYEVELVRADGAEIDVHLDEQFEVVATRGWHAD